MANEFDFGFTAVDEVPAEASQQPAAPSIDEDKIMDKLIELEAKILNAAKNKNLKMRGLSRKLAIEVWGYKIFK